MASAANVIRELKPLPEGVGVTTCPRCGAEVQFVTKAGAEKAAGVQCLSCGLFFDVRFVGEVKAVLAAAEAAIGPAWSSELPRVKLAVELRAPEVPSVAELAKSQKRKAKSAVGKFAHDERTVTEIARGILADDPAAVVYLAVHCGRHFVGSSPERFCPLCGAALKADRYGASHFLPADEAKREAAAESEPTRD